MEVSSDGRPPPGSWAAADRDPLSQAQLPNNRAASRTSPPAAAWQEHSADHSRNRHEHDEHEHDQLGAHDSQQQSGAAEDERPLPGWNTLDFGAGMQELTILRSIEEYLLYHGFEKSLNTLRKESATTLNNPANMHATGAMSEQAMLEAFDEGDGASFFRSWRRLDTTKAHSSLELRLRVHFAVLPMRRKLQNNEKLPRQQAQDRRFEELKDYLAEHQDDDGSMVAFYALPFVPTPHQHPELKHIFAKPWLDELRAETGRALAKLCAEYKTSKPRFPFLYALIEGPVSGSSFSLYPVKELIQIADAALKNMAPPSGVELRNRLKQILHAPMFAANNFFSSSSDAGGCSHRMLFPSMLCGGHLSNSSYTRTSSAGGLLQGSNIGMLGDDGRAKSRGFSRGVHSRQSLYSRYGARPNMTGPAAGPTIPKGGSRQSTLYSRSGSRSRGDGSRGAGSLPIGPCAKFDFGRIRNGLVERSAADQETMFISILKHCCSAFDPVADRRAFLHGICCFDVLHVGAGRREGDTPPAFESFLTFDACIALIAVIACEAGGRLYLSQNPKQLIRGLMQHLGRSDNTELQALVALQRLSLSQKMQEAMMIDENLLTWILGEFREFILYCSCAQMLHQNPANVSSSTTFSSGQNMLNLSNSATSIAGLAASMGSAAGGVHPGHHFAQQNSLAIGGAGTTQVGGSSSSTGPGPPMGGSSSSLIMPGTTGAPPGSNGFVDPNSAGMETFSQMAKVVAGLATPPPTGSRPLAVDDTTAAGAPGGVMISEITLEFGSALLMNLALRKEGKNYLERIPGTLPILAALMLCPHIDTQVRTYANATLYSLLGRPFFRQEAEKIGFRQILSSIVINSNQSNSSNGELSRQVECLIEQFSKSTDAAALEEEEEEIDEGDEECFLAEEELSAWVIPPNKVSSILQDEYMLSGVPGSSVAAGSVATSVVGSANGTSSGAEENTVGGGRQPSDHMDEQARRTYEANQKVFAQFLDNMQTLFRQAREEGQRTRGRIKAESSKISASTAAGAGATAGPPASSAGGSSSSGSHPVPSISIQVGAPGQGVLAGPLGAARTGAPAAPPSGHHDPGPFLVYGSNPYDMSTSQNPYAGAQAQPLNPYATGAGSGGGSHVLPTSSTGSVEHYHQQHGTSYQQHTSSGSSNQSAPLDPAHVEPLLSHRGSEPRNSENNVLTNVMNTSARNFDFSRAGSTVIQGSSLVTSGGTGMLVNSMQRSSGGGGDLLLGGGDNFAAGTAGGTFARSSRSTRPQMSGNSMGSSTRGSGFGGVNGGGGNLGGAGVQQGGGGGKPDTSPKDLAVSGEQYHSSHVGGADVGGGNHSGTGAASNANGSQAKKKSYGIFGSAAKPRAVDAAKAKKKPAPGAPAVAHQAQGKQQTATAAKPENKKRFFGIGRAQ